MMQMPQIFLGHFLFWFHVEQKAEPLSPDRHQGDMPCRPSGSTRGHARAGINLDQVQTQVNHAYHQPVTKPPVMP
jgi:hypothetical protein